MECPNEPPNISIGTNIKKPPLTNGFFCCIMIMKYDFPTVYFGTEKIRHFVGTSKKFSGGFFHGTNKACHVDRKSARDPYRRG
jgi:hypothetical protein